MSLRYSKTNRQRATLLWRVLCFSLLLACLFGLASANTAVGQEGEQDKQQEEKTSDKQDAPEPQQTQAEPAPVVRYDTTAGQIRTRYVPVPGFERRTAYEPVRSYVPTVNRVVDQPQVQTVVKPVEIKTVTSAAARYATVVPRYSPIQRVVTSWQGEAEREPVTVSLVEGQSGMVYQDSDADGYVDVWVDPKEVEEGATASGIYTWDIVPSVNRSGCKVQEIEETVRRQLGLEQGVGVVVVEVVEPSPGAEAGLQTHDIITQVNDTVIESVTAFDEVIVNEIEEYNIQLVRKGEPIQVQLTIPRQYDTLVFMQQPDYRIGVSVSEAGETLRSHLDLDEGVGVVIDQVFEDEVAAEVGLAVHDVIIEIDGQPVGDFETLRDAIQASEGNEMEIAYYRKNTRYTVRLSPRKHEKQTVYWHLDVTDVPQGQFQYEWKYAPIEVELDLTQELADESVAGQLKAIQSQLNELQQAINKLQAGLVGQPEE